MDRHLSASDHLGRITSLVASPRLALNRRQALTGLAAGAVALSTRGMVGVSAQSTSDFESGGLGLTKAAFEEKFGPGEPVEMTGHPIYDETYSYETQLGTIYAWYITTADQPYVAYIEIDFRGSTLEPGDATKRAESLLPSDARFTEYYLAPATPTGPIALQLSRYQSASLAADSGRAFAEEIVIMIQEEWGKPEDGSRVTGFSIMSRLMTQRG